MDAIDAVFASIGSGGTEAWYLADHLGSIRGLMNNSGTLIDTIGYDAFGNITSESSPSNGDRYKFDGGQYDSMTGLYQFGLRWYNPADATWVSQDLLGLSADSNPYRYVLNDPVNAIDLLGLDKVTLSIRGELGKKQEWGLNVSLKGNLNKEGTWIEKELDAYGKGGSVYRSFDIKEQIVNKKVQSVEYKVNKEQRFIVIVEEKKGPNEIENPFPGGKYKQLEGTVAFKVIELTQKEFIFSATLLKGGTIGYDFKGQTVSELEGRATLTLGEKFYYRGSAGFGGNPPIHYDNDGVSNPGPLQLVFPKTYKLSLGEQVIISWERN